MGGGGSKNNVVETKPNNLSNDILEYKRCVYFTFDEFNKKVHIPNEMLFVQHEINVLNQQVTQNFEGKNDIYDLLNGQIFDFFEITDTNIHISETKTLPPSIMSSLKLLNKMKSFLKPDISESVINIIKNQTYKYGKIALPIYVMYAKKLEYDTTYLTEWVEKNMTKETSLLDYFKQQHPESILAKYKWKGVININVYFPNMTKDGKIFTNLQAFKTQHFWLKSLAMDEDLLYSIYNVDGFDFEKFRKYLPPKIFDIMKKRFEIINSKQFLFKGDQQNTCFNHGCISDTGEDINALIPKYSNKENTMEGNSDGKSPYIPRKCLRPFNYSKNGFDDNKKFYDKLAKHLFKGDDSCYNKWKKNYELIKKGSTETDNNINANLIDELDSCAMSYISNEKRDKKNYSKWNHKILKELAKRSSTVPGIQEFSLPFFKIKNNNTQFNNLFYLLPWGDNLLSMDFGFSSGEKTSEPIVSANRNFKLMLDHYGRLTMYNNNNVIFHFNQKKLKNTSYISFEGGNISIYTKKQNFLESIPFVINDFKSPLSLIIENDGNLNVFENGFKNVLNKDIQNLYKMALQFYIQNHNENNNEHKSFNDYITQNNDKYQSYKDLYIHSEYKKKMINKLLNIAEQIK